MPVLLRDNFNRADLTDPSNGGAIPWNQTIHSGFPQSHDIVSNEFHSAVSSGWCSDWWGQQYGQNQAVEYTMRDMPSTGTFRCLLRLINPGVDATCTGYEFEIDGSNAYIVRIDAAFARTTIVVTGITFANGNRVRCECIGSTLNFYRDSGSGFVLIGTTTDANYVRSGYVGFITTNDTGVAIDDFYAGELTEQQSYYTYRRRSVRR